MKVKGNFLSSGEIEKLHQATLYVLKTVGVRFQSEAARTVFRQHGAEVDGEIVRISEKILQKALSSIPKSFVLHGREEEQDVLVGGEAPVFASSSGPVYVRRGGEKYLAKNEDYLNFIKLSETSPVLGVTNYIMVEPQDVAPDKRKLHQVACCLKYSTKPLIGITMGEGMSEECLRLVGNFYGGLTANRLLGIISPISPLSYDQQMLDHVLIYARNDQPLLFASCSLPGATSPVSLCGTMVIDNAEVLAGIILSQLVRPGLPVIYGNTSTACDLRYVSPAIGSPETGLVTLTTAALSSYYGIPCRSGGSLTDAKIPDMQAGIESAMTLLPAMVSGVDFILQSCGILESFNTLSYEKFIIDEETLVTARRFVQGYEISDDLLGLEMIGRLGPGANYLSEEHTAAHYRSEQYTPKIISREGFAQWTEAGGRDLPERAASAVEKRLEQYQPPQITAEQEKVLQDYLVQSQ